MGHRERERHFQKHKVRFRQASTIFRDLNQLTLYDEERWITVEVDSAGVLRVILHIFEQLDDDIIALRIISARKAVGEEREQYRGDMM